MQKILILDVLVKISYAISTRSHTKIDYKCRNLKEKRKPYK
jgi:hypothetical protein